jgi:hypothetical protein
MTPKQQRELWILGILVVVVDLILLFTLGFSILAYGLALLPLAYGVWLAIKWSAAWERRQD